jgi:hypothetical protein
MQGPRLLRPHQLIFILHACEHKVLTLFRPLPGLFQGYGLAGHTGMLGI